jgi:hypothetical protein
MMPVWLDYAGRREKGLSNYQIIKSNKVDDAGLIMPQQGAIIKSSHHQIIKLNRCQKEIITTY